MAKVSTQKGKMLLVIATIATFILSAGAPGMGGGIVDGPKILMSIIGF